MPRFVGARMPFNYVGLINAAATSAYNYVIGPISSSDGGATFTAGAAATFGPGSGWEATYVKDPLLIWDGSQFVMFYTGFDGSHLRIGRATDSVYTMAGASRSGSNPIVGLGAGGAFDETSANAPKVIYDATLSPPWRMWYNGNDALGVVSIGYADSTDGVAWTKRGQVLAKGTAGAFDDTGLAIGCALRVGALYYVFYAGWGADGFRHSAYATCTDPANSATYTKHGELSGFGGLISAGGWNWRSNVPSFVLPRAGRFITSTSIYNPGAATGPPTDTEEANGSAFSIASLTAWSVPSALLVPLDDGSWHANSGENPSIIAAP